MPLYGTQSGLVNNQFRNKTPWSPSLFGGKVVNWWDGSDPDSLTLSTNQVTQWRDKRKTQAALPGDPTNPPTISKGGINGLDAVSFHGGQYLTFPATGIVATNFVFACVVLFTDFNSYPTIMAGNGDGGNRCFQIRGSNTGGIQILLQGVNGSMEYGGGLLATNTPALVVFSDQDNLMTTRVNGVQIDSVVKPAFSLLPSYNLGCRTPNVEQMEGLMGECLFFGVPDIDPVYLEGYLASKWKIQTNLPADHPFRTMAPLL